MSSTTKYRLITTSILENDIIRDHTPAVLIFGASWSGNSEMMDSMIERISQEYDQRVQFFKVDIDAQQEIASFFGVTQIPTTIMIQAGEVIDFTKGFLPARKMRAKIQTLYDNLH